MRKIVAVTATVFFALSVASQANASTIAVIDQPNTVDGETRSPDFKGVVTESCTPTLTKIDAAEFVFEAAGRVSLLLTLYSEEGSEDRLSRQPNRGNAHWPLLSNRPVQSAFDDTHSERPLYLFVRAGIGRFATGVRQSLSPIGRTSVPRPMAL